MLLVKNEEVYLHKHPRGPSYKTRVMKCVRINMFLKSMHTHFCQR